MRFSGLVTAIGIAALLTTGCNKKTGSANRDSDDFKSTIANFYNDHPECLFPSGKKFPIQVDSKDQTATRPWDALVDQGLLTRSVSEKSKLVILTTPVNVYDISEKGRSTWKPDPNVPSTGNFCYGNRHVENITGSTPVADHSPGVSTVVSYNYSIANVPDWAKVPAVQNSYLAMRNQLASNISTQDTLVLTSNHGWQLQRKAAMSADGSIVQ